jgi:hypothetical protein
MVPFYKFWWRNGLFSGQDVRVTESKPNQSRDESTISVNPIDSSNLFCSSKKFINPQKYHFTISTSYSMDGGSTWIESELPLSPGWDGMTDPATAFDSQGNAFIVVGPLKFQPTVPPPDDILVLGVYAFKSVNGGQTWTGPMRLDIADPRDEHDDKQWIACDNNSSSPYYGNVYVAWGASSPLRFARSTDHGQTWKGVGNQPSGSKIAEWTFAPEISVGHDGTIHIVWHQPNTSTIQYMRSTNGGESFEPQTVAVSGMKGFHGNLPQDPGDSFPHFPNAQFRVLTLATGTDAPNNRFIVAWADMRDGEARIYYRIAEQNGTTWIGPVSGQPLLPWLPKNKGFYDFHPQLNVTRSGVVGCAFYRFSFYQYGLTGKHMINTLIAASFSEGNSFEFFETVSDSEWDPAVNAPWAHGNPNETFIGEYFGFDADEDAFVVLWTSNYQTGGVHELFFDRVATGRYEIPEKFKGISAEILAGVTSDGGGLIIVGGKIIKVPPRGPMFDILNALAALDAVEQIRHPSGVKVARSLTDAIGAVVKDMGKKYVR